MQQVQSIGTCAVSLYYLAIQAIQLAIVITCLASRSLKSFELQEMATLIGFDQDPTARELASAKIQTCGRDALDVRIIADNFRYDVCLSCRSGLYSQATSARHHMEASPSCRCDTFIQNVVISGLCSTLRVLLPRGYANRLGADAATAHPLNQNIYVAHEHAVHAGMRNW